MSWRVLDFANPSTYTFLGILASAFPLSRQLGEGCKRAGLQIFLKLTALRPRGLAVRLCDTQRLAGAATRC